MFAPIGVLLCLSLAACHASGSLGPDGLQQGSDVVTVRPDQFGQTVTLSMSQSLAVPRPAEVEEWSLSFAREVIDYAMPADQVRRPGAAGWRFRPVAPGETALVFTTVPPPCPPGTPCSPPPPREFALTVRVTR